MFFSKLRADIRAAQANDPAARSRFEILLTYHGVKALAAHRRAAFFHRIGLKTIARMISQGCKRRTGIEIHPAAKIAPGVFIDHGSGVVIGETAEVGEGTVLYQGCTLGGTGKETGKRHPTVGKNCVISAGAKVLGGITLGDYVKVGAGAVVLRDVPSHATVVGVPARIVRIRGSKEGVDLLQEKEDPLQIELCALRERVFALEDALARLGAAPIPHDYKPAEEKIPEMEEKERKPSKVSLNDYCLAVRDGRYVLVKKQLKKEEENK
ncbi:MAG: serine O-acetyltransferase [Clostridia bacterium]|nr:serine O-acetyltransferase [Clostridia bacterium]